MFFAALRTPLQTPTRAQVALVWGFRSSRRSSRLMAARSGLDDGRRRVGLLVYFAREMTNDEGVNCG